MHRLSLMTQIVFVRAKQLKMEWLKTDHDFTKMHEYPSKGLFIFFILQRSI